MNETSQESWLKSRPTKQPVPDSSAEICVNCWHFTDATGLVLRLAAKAYALSGTDEEKLTTLKFLAASDYLTAIQGRVPEKFVVSMDGSEFRGAIPAAALQLDPVPVYEEIFDAVVAALPELMRSVDDDYEAFKMELREPFLWVSTCVFEESDGTLTAHLA